ncbi:uncharacterized protein LOC130125975 [Lampris incognitus]|uniref:uncharacterized protein LOC130125975 n=1 Tax=Lampris incognitus TaxID=2546036 RepID=UPI0024B49C74|nr:uncharacterized protein LOC130125975 [Lampris incognitus]
MSVSTECTFRTESDWDPHDESSSMISFDMTEPNNPLSPSRSFKSSEEKKGVLDRISNFFNTKRKRNPTRQSLDASSDASQSDSSTPVSPLSPHPHQPLGEDESNTPTTSRRHIDVTGPVVTKLPSREGANHGISSSPSVTSLASLLMDKGELPFAHSDSSSRSSVREVTVCRVSSAKDRNSGDETPTPTDFPASSSPNAALNPEPGFVESVVCEVSRRLQVDLEKNILQREAVPEKEIDAEHTNPKPLDSPPSKACEAPKSRNLLSIIFKSKTSLKLGEKGKSTAQVGETSVTHSSSSPNSAPPIQPKDSADMERINSGSMKRALNLASKTVPAVCSTPTDREEQSRGTFPAEIHKAIWVETHLDKEEGESERDGKGEKEEEGFRADSPPVLAVPATVIPVEGSVTDYTLDSPFTASETFATIGREPALAISTAATSGEFQTKAFNSADLPQPETVFAKKVYVCPELNVDEDEKAEIDPGWVSGSNTLTSKTSEEAKVLLKPAFKNISVALEEPKHEPFLTTDDFTGSDTDNHVPLATEDSPKVDSENFDLNNVSATLDMPRHKPKLQVKESGVISQGTTQTTPPKQGPKTSVEHRSTTASQAKSPSTTAGTKVKNIPAAKGKVFTESTKVATSSDAQRQKEHKDEKMVSSSLKIKDNAIPGNTSRSSGAGSSKSRIPTKSPTDTDTKSPVAPDKNSVADVSGSVVSSKTQKQPKSKDSLKDPTDASQVGRKPGFDEGKGGKPVSGEISTTKAPSRAIAKLAKEKEREDINSLKLVNGLEKTQEKSKKITQPNDRENQDVKKQGQTPIESNVSLIPKRRLPISSPTRNRNDRAPQTSGTDSKKIPAGQAEKFMSSKLFRPTSPEQQECTSPSEELAGKILPCDSEVPGKETKLCKPLTKGSVSHEENDMPTCHSPHPPKPEKPASLKLGKQSDISSTTNKQSQKSPLKDSNNPSSSISKLPMRHQKRPNKGLESSLNKEPHSQRKNLAEVSERLKKGAKENEKCNKESMESTDSKTMIIKGEKKGVSKPEIHHLRTFDRSPEAKCLNCDPEQELQTVDTKSLKEKMMEIKMERRLQNQRSRLIHH